jgi:hypothetical protein
VKPQVFVSSYSLPGVPDGLWWSCRQKYAKPGELNYDWSTSGSSFFTHYDDLQEGSNCDDIPPVVMRHVLGGGELNPEPPRVE